METCLMKYYILNGELRNGCDFNPGILTSGKGIYEVFRVINGIPLFFKEHLKRFYRSLELVGYKSADSEQNIVLYLKTLVQANGLKTGNVQFQVIRQEDGKQVFIAWITPAIYPTTDQFENGVDVFSYNAIRELPQIKSANLSARVEANRLIEQQDIFEVVLFDDNDVVTEGSRSNIFFTKGNTLYTPSVDLVLPGITRSEVISIVKQQHIDINKEPIYFNAIDEFDAAFLTSTSMKILPIKAIDDVEFNTSNSLIQKLKLLYDETISRDIEEFSWD